MTELLQLSLEEISVIERLAPYATEQELESLHLAITGTPTATATENDRVEELRRCRESPAYFLNHYGKIFDPAAREWVPFALWPAQVETLGLLHVAQLL